MKRILTLTCMLLLSLATFVQAEQGNPKIDAIEAIAFGPDGLLLIGGKGRVVTVETGDTKEATWSKSEIASIDQVLAGKLGLSSKDIEIKKIAVNPASRKAYIAVRSLKAKTNSSVILTVDGAGAIGEFALDNVKYTSYSLSVPALAVTRITDITWAGGKIVAATQATDKFSSRVFTINPTVKNGSPVQVSTETYHVGHGKWETKAPILCIMPYEENGKTSVVGSFTCTPIVKYAIDDQKTDAQVKGTSILELGTGNTPRSMFAYEKDGKKYILVNVARNNKMPAFGFPSAYWVARVDADMLKETTAVNEKAPWRIGGKAQAGDRVNVAKEYFGVYQMDKLDSTRALVIQEQKGAFTLRAVPLP